MEKTNLQRVVLFPLPLQGCINPTIQLANILHSNGFSITVIHTRFNSLKPSNHPHFTFLQISDGLSETETRTQDITLLVTLLNQRCETPFRDCLSKVLESAVEEKEKICCLIDDCGWYFTQSVAKSLNLRRFVLNSYHVAFFRSHFLIPQLRREEYLRVQDSEAEDLVPEFSPLRKKDLTRILNEESNLLDSYLNATHKSTKSSSALIFMSGEDLDQNSLIKLRQEYFQIPIFSIGPFDHTSFPTSSSSLLEQDNTCIPWLNYQQENSVIYVSFGSIASLKESDLLEIAWGLSNSNQPFLWVVRPSSVQASGGALPLIERIPKEVMEKLNEKGKIVKWAPQQDVLAHRAVGGFLTHCGWNSTVESICEGVPMICLPFHWDQMLNARFVSEIWKIGIHLEGLIERNEIEKVIKRLMVDESEEIRERLNVVKEKVKRSVEENGESYCSLRRLIDFISFSG